jgi:hypothetical protein
MAAWALSPPFRRAPTCPYRSSSHKSSADIRKAGIKTILTATLATDSISGPRQESRVGGTCQFTISAQTRRAATTSLQPALPVHQLKDIHIPPPHLQPHPALLNTIRKSIAARLRICRRRHCPRRPRPGGHTPWPQHWIAHQALSVPALAKHPRVLSPTSAYDVVMFSLAVL